MLKNTDSWQRSAFVRLKQESFACQHTWSASDVARSSLALARARSRDMSFSYLHKSSLLDQSARPANPHTRIGFL